ncbi:hypothetical protein JR316_0002628 [Psilocybe cubensis]|uniref:Uncharacterized protein n=1 Tax=Psilocybe cubensis TaxID=181762 RepID=A0ACB8HDA9_PSICU|nr:hypothetical protein JR316_0002628 [Psilocybe cubensis]KAH9485715.1 hypothetical protein JR316_0002628 [Psilocybe cubensis]
MAHMNQDCINLFRKSQNALEDKSTISIEEANRELALVLADLVVNHTILGTSLSSFPACADVQSAVDFLERSFPGFRDLEINKRYDEMPQIGGTLESTETEAGTKVKAFETVTAGEFMRAEAHVVTASRNGGAHQLVEIDILEVD